MKIKQAEVISIFTSKKGKRCASLLVNRRMFCANVVLSTPDELGLDIEIDLDKIEVGDLVDGLTTETRGYLDTCIVTKVDKFV